MSAVLMLALVCAILAVVYGWISVLKFSVCPRVTNGCRRSQAIRGRASAYLARQYKTIAMVGGVLSGHRLRAKTGLADRRRLPDRRRLSGRPVSSA